ncbi:MAG: hypothetical protein V1799_11390 [bacterium]
MNESIPTGEQEEKSKNATNEENQESDDLKKNNTPIRVIVNEGKIEWGSVTEWILVVITIILSFFTWKTAQYAAEQTKAATDAARSAQASYELSKQIADSADASSARSFYIANKSVAAAESSIVLGRKNVENYERVSKIEMRPYVVHDTDVIVINLIVGQKISATYWSKNVGKTPAFNYFHVNNCLVIDTMRQDYLDEVFKVALRNTKGGIALGSDIRESKLGIYGIYTHEESIAIAEGRKTIVLYGVISYSDIFNERHLTWYCLERNKQRNQLIMNPKYCGMN